MRNKVYNFLMNIDWNLINTISRIDRFDSNWAVIEKKEGKSLKQLRNVAIVKSIAASSRLEGSNMTDEEANVFLQKYHETSKPNGRIMNEITDYFETMEALSDSFASITISENTVLNIHAVLMRYKKKDNWLKNLYKQRITSNTLQNVTKQILSRSSNNSGFSLTNPVNKLIDWYNEEQEIHSLIKIAIFSYEFLSVYPFQAGNKRISRLFPLLLLLKSGYNWLQYVSLESEIENRKDDYYKIIRICQENRPNENITEWILFFLDMLIQLQEQLMEALKRSGIETRLSPREKAIIAIISSNPGSKSGEIASKLSIPNPTTKRILANLLQNGFIERYGNGRSTNYSID